MREWSNSTAAAWGFLIVGIAVGGVLTYLSPTIGIPVCIVLLLIGFLLLIRAYRHRNTFGTKKEGEMPNSERDDVEQDKPTIVKDTQVKLDAKDTEKATGMEITTPTELDNVRVDVTAENVKDVTGLKVTAVNKEFALRVKTIVCSCGAVLRSATTHGYKPTIICHKCGKEYKD